MREQEKKERKKSNKNESKAINKMAIRTYISIITLNVNGLKPQPKDIDWLKGYKNKTHIYAVFKRPTSLPGTHTNGRREDGRKYSMQTGIKINLE